MAERLRCSVCGAGLPAAARAGFRCRPCARELINGRRRQARRDLGGRRACEGKSLRHLADPEGWAGHLERLAARAAAGLPLFD